MNIYTLTVSLTKLSSDDYPTPTVPTTEYKASRLFVGDEDGEAAKVSIQFLAKQIGLDVVEPKLMPQVQIEGEK